MASTYLQRTPTARTNSKKFTYSCWFKRSKIASAGYLVINLESGNDRGYVVLDANDKFNVYDVAGGTVRLNILSNFVLRDTNAWYHLVYSVDSTAGSNRTKFYINGVDRYSDFTVTTARAQDGTVGFQQGTVSNSFKIGSQESGSTTFDGLMSHINFVDGLQLDATAFGETDSTTGEWKIKTSPTVSEYGNNGFFILKDGNSVTDQSGKGNNFTVGGGTLTKTEDNPSNVFATLNVLASTSTPNFSNGNTSIYANTQNSWNQLTPATFVMPSSGKFYWEVKNTSSSHPNYINPGFMNANYYNNLLANSGFPGNVYDANNGFWNGMQGGGDNNNYSVYRAGTASNITISESFTNGDILSFAVDLDNRKAWLGKNGTYIQSGNPSNGTNETWSSADIDANTDYVPGIAHYYTNPSASFNFGNGYFGTTAVSSAGTNASGNGIFEFDVPNGFTALSTKGLNL